MVGRGYRFAVVLRDARSLWLTKSPGSDPNDSDYTAAVVTLEGDAFRKWPAYDATRALFGSQLTTDVRCETVARLELPVDNPAVSPVVTVVVARTRESVAPPKGRGLRRLDDEPDDPASLVPFTRDPATIVALLGLTLHGDDLVLGADPNRMHSAMVKERHSISGDEKIEWTGVFDVTISDGPDGLRGVDLETGLAWARERFADVEVLTNNVRYDAGVRRGGGLPQWPDHH